MSKTFSLEFFPPKNAQAEAKLWDVISKFSEYNPDFISITYGAGGGDRERTVEFTCRVKQDTNLSTVAHLTCVGDNEDELSQILDRYQTQGITTILALRGDIPKSAPEQKSGVFPYADHFVSFIRNRYPEFKIGVAAYPEVHPQAANREADLINFKKKVDAGADFAITQFFFDNKDYFEFISECKLKDIHIPIIPGIMPITDFKQINKLTQLCGSQLPMWLSKRLEELKDDPIAMQEFGIEVAAKQSQDLLDNGAPSLHFFTMNRTPAVLKILERIS
ncbi:MAG: methylenetetrahydrofolate reductase [NAD(P)H] [Magnetococcales bacterium]|nr:methylenetetrahydrofolate reductase [NAD(P)H] [Magnetococcales bacterium]